jgi:hypothetical protein
MTNLPNLIALLVVLAVAAHAIVTVQRAGRLNQPTEPPVLIERAEWLRLDDGSDGDPTWYMRALSYGHDPDLSHEERRALAADFHRFDRIMTDAFSRLDRIGATT